MEDPAKNLVDELCSLLDEATILSIASDYNLSDPQEFAAARGVLLTLSEGVEAEEATGFNPSGLGLDDVVEINPPDRSIASVEDALPAEPDVRSNDGFTTTTEGSQPKSLISDTSSKTSTTLESPGPGFVFVGGVFDGLSHEEKEKLLADMFIELKALDVKLALQKAKGDASLAIDELLNLQWLEQMGQRPKGVEGFYVSDDNLPSKRKKNRKKKGKVTKQTTPRDAESVDAVADAGQSDEKHDDNIAFLTDRFSLSAPDAKSLYFRHKTSLGAAIIEILDNYIAVDLHCSDPSQQALAQTQADKFSWVPPRYFDPIFDILPSDQAAIEVINILADHFEKPSYLKYDLSYSVVASDLGLLSPTLKDPIASNFKNPTSKAPSVGTIAGTFSAAASRTPLSPTTTTHLSSSDIAASRSHSFNSATSAYRKGKSNPLYRQAAAYYAERGHQQTTSLQAASSAEARLLVDHNSHNPKDTIDLHGVTVLDGVNIAIDRTWRWWEGLGLGEEPRKQRARREGFTIVTGLGRHSSDGRSRLRTNVFKALVADGWKVEVMTGSFLVVGRTK